MNELYYSYILWELKVILYQIQYYMVFHKLFNGVSVVTCQYPSWVSIVNDVNCVRSVDYEDIFVEHIQNNISEYVNDY